jgi:hypothetical protein
MKKTFIMAAALAIAATFASCEKEPTALEPENLNSKATICGFVQIQTYKEDSKVLVANALEPMADQQIAVLYGTDDGTGNITYVEYNATTNRDGYYTIDLPVALGKQIDDVKVQLKLFKEHATAAYYVNSSAENVFITTDAWFQAEANAAAPAGQTLVLDLTLEPVEGTSHADLTLK